MMQVPRFFPIIMLVGCLGLSFASTAESARAKNKKPPIPDFTQGDKPYQDEHDWTLGPTGARGWLYAWDRTSTESRQIYITKVENGSPASGVLKVGDVILGVEGKKFQSDARIAFGKQINKAEADKGRLQLLVWRGGKTAEVTIKLPPLGGYSPTAPYDCPKSERIFSQGCEAIARKVTSGGNQVVNPITRSLNAMVLLASGERKYLPLLRKEAQWAAKFKANQFASWYYGYANMFLTEYAIATGDRSVLPGVKRLSIEIANGQSEVGTWGHKFANPETGVLYGYGAMNAPALPLTMSLVLARELGLKDSRTDRAIKKSETYLGFYADKGGIPYGDHHPSVDQYDPNGKTSAAAVLFDLLGDEKKADLFARMATAAHGLERDVAHTGNFFTQIWPIPAVSRCGPNATGGWIQEAGWRLDLARRWDGGYLYQGLPGTHETTKDHKYPNWDASGAYLLNYAVAKKSLRITGKKTSVAQELSPEEVASLLDDGRGWSLTEKSKSYNKKSDYELLAGMESWSPIVRHRSAKALANRKNGKLLQTVMNKLKRGDIHAKLGACETIEFMGRSAAPAIPLLTKTLKNKHAWLRVQAAEALSSIGDPALVAAPQLLKLAAETDDSDPRQMTQRYLSFLLFDGQRTGNFRGLLAKSVSNIDRELLYEAMAAVLLNDDGRARGSVRAVYKHLQFEDVEPLMPIIVRSIEEPSPSGVMFSGQIRLAGIELLAKHRIAEGMPLCIVAMDHNKWGKGARIIKCLKALEKYGAAAKSQIPALKQVANELAAGSSKGTNDGNAKKIIEAIARIERATNTPQLRSVTL